MLPDQRRDRSEIRRRHRRHPRLPFWLAQDTLHHERVDVDHGVLEEMQAEHAGLVVLMAVADQFATLGEKDEVVGAVPLLDQVEPFIDLAAQRLAVKISAEEDGCWGATEQKTGLRSHQFPYFKI